MCVNIENPRNNPIARAHTSSNSQNSQFCIFKQNLMKTIICHLFMNKDFSFILCVSVNEESCHTTHKKNSQNSVFIKKKNKFLLKTNIPLSLIFEGNWDIHEIKILHTFGENSSKKEVDRSHTSNNSQNS